MATLTTLLTDLNDLLDDATNAKVTEAQKIRYINRGQYAMWPKVYQFVQDETVVLAANTFEYSVPAGFAEGQILSVELETSSTSDDFIQLDGRVFDLLPTTSFNYKLVLKETDALPGEVASKVRITGVIPLTELTTGTDTYSGPAVTEELPVLYAMALATARDYEGRLDYTRYATTLAQNGVLLEDITSTSNWWMRQFQLLLDQVRMPLPNL